jgi:hypothetical protein
MSQPPECFLQDKVFCTKCTEEEFVIGQVLRCSGMELLDLYFFSPLFT